MDASMVRQLVDAARATGLDPDRALAEALALGECMRGGGGGLHERWLRPWLWVSA